MMKQNRRQSLAAFFVLLPLLALLFSGWMHPCFHGASHASPAGDERVYDGTGTCSDTLSEAFCPVCAGFFDAAEAPVPPLAALEARQLPPLERQPQAIRLPLSRPCDARAPPCLA